MWNDTPQIWQSSISIANSETLYFCIHPRRAPSKNPAENPPPSGIESFSTVCDFFHQSSTSSPSNFPSSFYFQAFDRTKLGERLLTVNNPHQVFLRETHRVQWFDGIVFDFVPVDINVTHAFRSLQTHESNSNQSSKNSTSFTERHTGAISHGFISKNTTWKGKEIESQKSSCQQKSTNGSRNHKNLAWRTSSKSDASKSILVLVDELLDNVQGIVLVGHFFLEWRYNCRYRNDCSSGC